MDDRDAIAGVIRAARALASWHFAALAVVDPDVYSAVLIDKETTK